MAGWDALDIRYRDRATSRKGSCSRLGSVCELIAPTRFTRHPLGPLSASHVTPRAFSPPPENIAPPSASELIARHAVPLPLTFVEDINARLNELKAPLSEEDGAPQSCDMEDSPPFPVLIEDFQSFDVISGEFLSPCCAETHQPEVASFDEQGQRRIESPQAQPPHRLASSSGPNESDVTRRDASANPGVRSSVDELTRHLNSTQQLRHRALWMALGGGTNGEGPRMKVSAQTRTSGRGEARQHTARVHRQTAEGLPALAHLRAP